MEKHLVMISDTDIHRQKAHTNHIVVIDINDQDEVNKLPKVLEKYYAFDKEIVEAIQAIRPAELVSSLLNQEVDYIHAEELETIDELYEKTK